MCSYQLLIISQCQAHISISVLHLIANPHKTFAAITNHFEDFFKMLKLKKVK